MRERNTLGPESRSPSWQHTSAYTRRHVDRLIHMKRPEICDFGQRSNAVTSQKPTRRVLSANMEARESYEHWHGRFDIDENADAPWHRMLRRHLDPQRDVAGKHVLEIGCGRGGFTTSLA